MTSEERKEHPVFLGMLSYFPDAVMAVANHSFKANEKHNPGTSVHWDRSKSTDELDALTRHIVDLAKGEKFCSDGLRTSTSIAWRALANLQKELEAEAKEVKERASNYMSLKDSHVGTGYKNGNVVDLYDDGDLYEYNNGVFKPCKEYDPADDIIEGSLCDNCPAKATAIIGDTDERYCHKHFSMYLSKSQKESLGKFREDIETYD